MLRRRYPHDRTADIAATLTLPLAIVYARANALGLKKSAKFQASGKSGRILRGGKLSVATQFKPGQISHTKGLRRPGYAPGRMRQTQFKRGQMPHNTLPVGSFRTSKDGYLEQKYMERPGSPSRRWRSYHRLVWERKHGPVRRGFVVVFKPNQYSGVAEEITLDKLELIPRAELARRNRMWTRYPSAVARTINLLGQVKRRIREKERASAQD